MIAIFSSHVQKYLENITGEFCALIIYYLWDTPQFQNTVLSGCLRDLLIQLINLKDVVCAAVQL